MKKILLLSVMTFGLMSFTNAASSSEDAMLKNEAMGTQTCCTATITYNGEPYTTVRECVNGTGIQAGLDACAKAAASAQALIKMYSFTFNPN